MKRLLAIAWIGLFTVAGGCQKSADVPGVPVTTLPGHDQLPEDDTPKESPRMIPPETYIRSYLALFGGLSPIDVQKAARGKDGSALFDSWNDYLSSLGLPDYRVDVPRGTQTNTLMLTTLERLGIALCDRAVEHDLQGATPLPLKDRVVFAFDAPKGTVDAAAFTPGFDILHRTFLGYPSRLAPAARAPRYLKLYGDTVAAHATVKGSRFTPGQAGWAAVCYALIRHPEFQLY